MAITMHNFYSCLYWFLPPCYNSWQKGRGHQGPAPVSPPLLHFQFRILVSGSHLLKLICNVRNATSNLHENVLKISHLVATTYVYLSSEAETFSSFPVDPLSCNVQPPGFSLMTPARTREISNHDPIVRRKLSPAQTPPVCSPSVCQLFLCWALYILLCRSLPTTMSFPPFIKAYLIQKVLLDVPFLASLRPLPPMYAGLYSMILYLV